jgi:putative transposase
VKAAFANAAFRKIWYNKLMTKQIFHKNSQKRFYNLNHIYFITTVCHKRFPFFREDLFCELFIDNLRNCKKTKNFKLFGFTIIPDHVHLLLKPEGEFNISEIMFSIKKQFSHNVNRIMGHINLTPIIEGGQALARLPGEYKLIFQNMNNDIVNKYFIDFTAKHTTTEFSSPPFKWQESFHDHVIRDEKDFFRHLKYIHYNCVKHNICDNPEKYRWSFLNPEFKDLVDDYFK